MEISEKKKLKYESPKILDLGEMAKGVGLCQSGSSNSTSGTCDVGGGAVGGACGTGNNNSSNVCDVFGNNANGSVLAACNQGNANSGSACSGTGGAPNPS